MSVSRSKGGMLFDGGAPTPTQLLKKRVAWRFANITPSVINMAAPTNVGTTSTVSVNTATRWGTLDQQGWATTAASSVCGMYLSDFTNSYKNNAGNYSSKVASTFGIRDNNNTSVLSGCRLFVGESQSAVAPTDVDPKTLTNVIGVIQSNTLPNPNNLYLIINGTGSSPWLFDTGEVIALNVGWLLQIEPVKNSTKIKISLTNINTEKVISQTIDLSTLSAGAKPANGTYVHRAWRSTNNRLGLDARLNMGFVDIEGYL